MEKIERKKQRRLAKKNLMKIINLLTPKEREKMLEDTRTQIVSGKKKPSMCVKTWVINNVHNKSRFYSEGLLIQPMSKVEKMVEDAVE